MDFNAVQDVHERLSDGDVGDVGDGDDTQDGSLEHVDAAFLVSSLGNDPEDHKDDHDCQRNDGIDKCADDGTRYPEVIGHQAIN